MSKTLHRTRLAMRVASSLVLLSGFTSFANASTTVSGTLTSNTTWTLAGSPYIVQTFLWVNPGVTLTIQPGVVVKFTHPSGPYGGMQVRGNIVAIGTGQNRITFTSLEDDSVGGDTGGDGPTTGAYGQWASIAVRSAGTMTFDYVDVQYGGWGSSIVTYSAILVYNGGYATLDHARIKSNQNSGLLVSAGATADIAHSEFSLNDVGVSVAGATALIHSNSFLSSNRDTGLYISLISTFTGAATSVLNSEISNNLNWGVWLLVDASVPNLPYGHESNIRNNGVPNTDQRQLFSSYALAQSLWTNNYWGDIQSEVPCPWAPPTTAQNHLSFDPLSFEGYCAEPGKGPVAKTTWTMPGCPNNKPMVCAADQVTNSPFASIPFDNSGF